MVELSVLNELVDKEIELIDRERPPYRTNKEIYNELHKKLNDLLEDVNIIESLIEYDIPKTIRKEEGINVSLIRVDDCAGDAVQSLIQILAICMRAELMDENEYGERKPADY